jgi:Uma2 family endonuclease
MATDLEIDEATAAEPQRWRWTRDSYHRLHEAGFFQNQRVELLDGEILTNIAQGPRHVVSAHRVVKALERTVGEGFWVRMHAPLALNESDEPEPDAAIVPGDEDYDEHPTTALLVVEVSDASRRFDRGPKAIAYAASGIPEYWVVDLVDNQLHVYRAPGLSGYAQPRTLGLDESIQLFAIPQAKVEVVSLFPRQRRQR